MRRIILIALLLAALVSSPAFATDVYISDRGGSHVGYCEDNGIIAASFANAYNLNYGGSTATWVGGPAIGPPFITRTLQRYDLSMIPDDATIQAAEIVIEVTGIIGGGDTVKLRMIADANNNWVEGTEDNATQVGSSCWNDKAYQNISEWGSPGLSTVGLDFESEALSANLAVSTTGSKTLPFTANGLAAITGRLGDDDIEFVFRNSTTTQDNFFAFASSEHGTVAFRPYLKITYELAGGAAQVLIIQR